MDGWKQWATREFQWLITEHEVPMKLEFIASPRRPVCKIFGNHVLALQPTINLNNTTIAEYRVPTTIFLLTESFRVYNICDRINQLREKRNCWFLLVLTMWYLFGVLHVPASAGPAFFNLSDMFTGLQQTISVVSLMKPHRSLMSNFLSCISSIFDGQSNNLTQVPSPLPPASVHGLPSAKYVIPQF